VRPLRTGSWRRVLANPTLTNCITDKKKHHLVLWDCVAVGSQWGCTFKIRRTHNAGNQKVSLAVGSPWARTPSRGGSPLPGVLGGVAGNRRHKAHPQIARDHAGGGTGSRATPCFTTASKDDPLQQMAKLVDFPDCSPQKLPTRCRTR